MANSETRKRCNRAWKRRNRAAVRASKRRWYKRWAEKNLRAAILARHGVDEAWFARKLLAQDNGCGICGKQTNGKRPLSVDHDHATGQNRGLLCHRCNQIVAYFERDPHFHEKIFAYLKQYAGEARHTTMDHGSSNQTRWA